MNLPYHLQKKVGCYDWLSRNASNQFYHPSIDTWIPVAKMCVRRSCAGVRVLNGVMYAVDGHENPEARNNLEAWSLDFFCCYTYMYIVCWTSCISMIWAV